MFKLKVVVKQSTEMLQVTSAYTYKSPVKLTESGLI